MESRKYIGAVLLVLVALIVATGCVTAPQNATVANGWIILSLKAVSPPT